MESSMYTQKKNIQLSPGQQFQHYHIDSVVGEGAMGIVYKAYDTKRQQHVALKVLQADFIGEKQHRQFVREVKAIAKLHHRNIVKLFDVGTHPTYYFTMEYVAGKTLEEVIHDKDVTIHVIVQIIHKVSLALYHAHVKGIIHGDIKPQNIVVDSNYEPKMMDFGLAKNRKSHHDCTQVLQGTPAYLSPEQLQHKAANKRSDIYSLGVTLYYALTKQLPFVEKNYAALFYQIVNRDPQKPSEINAAISVDLEKICLKCIQRSPQLRYANAKFLACDLQEFIAGKSFLQKLARKMRTVTLLFLAELLLFCGLIALIFLCSFPQKQEVKKSPQVITEYKWDDGKWKYLNSSYREDHIGHFMILSRRYGVEPSREWINKAHPIATEIYQTLQKLSAPVVAINLAEQYLQTVIEIQRSEFIVNESFYFAAICAYGLKKAKKYKVRDYIKKFEDFRDVHDLHIKLRASNIRARQETLATKRKLISQVTSKVSEAHAYLQLAFFDEVRNWQREKLLLRAIFLNDSYAFYEKLGEYYIRNYLYEEGIAVCQRAIEKNPYSFVARYSLAQAFIFREEYSAAFHHLDFLEKNFFARGREEVFLEKVRLFFVQKKIKQALQALDDAKKWHKNAVEKIGGFNERYQQWQNFIENTQHRDIRAQDRVRLYYLTGKIDKAYELVNETHNTFLQLAIYYEVLCKKAHEFDPAHEIWYKAYALVEKLMKSAKNFDVRAVAYRYAFMLLATRQGTKYNVYFDLEKPNMRSLLRIKNELGKYHFTELYLARFARHVGNNEEAVTLCQQAQQVAPWYKRQIQIFQKNSLARWFNYQAPGNQKHNVNAAIKLATELIDNHNYAPAHILLGFIYTHKSVDESKAQYHFSQVKPHTLSITNLLDFHHDYAHLHAKQHRYDAAISHMENYLKLSPDFIFAREALQRFRKKRGK